VIEAKLDVGYSVTGTAAGGAPRSRTDPLRRLEWFKTRFPELTPADPLLLERVWAGPEGGERPRYRRAGGALVEGATGAGRRAGVDGDPSPPPALTGTAERVLAALRTAGPPGATMKGLAEACGLPRQRVHEALTEALIPRSLARVGGFRDTPGGGPRASLYVAVGGPQSPTDGHRGHLRLVAPPPPVDAGGPGRGGPGVGDPPTEPAVGGAPGGGA
jgi:hypothetical protein